MAELKKICRLVSKLYLSFLAIGISVGPSILARDAGSSSSKMEREQGIANGNAKQNSIEEINRSTTPKISLEVKPFEPIVFKFPDTPPRKGEAANKYANNLLASLKSGAFDPNLNMTGESCARGLGTLYIV